MTHRINRRASLVALLCLAAMSATAHEGHDHATGIEVREPWARASAGRAANGAAYFTITNHGTAQNQLVSAASPVARTVELHTHLMDNGVMRMRQIPAIDVKPGEPAVLRPGGMHVMLIGLAEPLREGTSFPLTLRFAGSSEQVVQVRVLGPGAMGPGATGTGRNSPAARGHGH